MSSSHKISLLAGSFVAAIVLLATTNFVHSTPQQMEKRIDALYRQRAFESSFPKVGQSAPELELKTIDGQPVKLSSFYGRPIVLIKGSYT